jgi:hypothetical protein
VKTDFCILKFSGKFGWRAFKAYCNAILGRLSIKKHKFDILLLS